jgi:hypothetical protein
MILRTSLTISSALLIGCATTPAIVEKQPYPLTPCLVTQYEIETNSDLANAYLVARSELRECANQVDAAIKYNKE